MKERSRSLAHTTTTTTTLHPAPTSSIIVSGVQHNARAQRVAIDYGNGVTTTSTYDPTSFRLTRQHAVRV